MDTVSSEKRSEIMRQITSKGTKPEIIVRRLIYSLGYRYRLHRRDLPGQPDIVFAKRRKIIFIHGCFWHQHDGCKSSHIPKTRQDYWVPKLFRNVSRDKENQSLLRQHGWEILIIWECQIKNINNLTYRIKAFLGGD